MSNFNKTVDFIKEIEKLKSVTRFNRTLDGRFEIVPSILGRVR